MEKSNIFLIVFAIFIAFSSCEKDNETTIFYWNETGCSNPWELDNNDTEEEKKEKIENYLDTSMFYWLLFTHKASFSIATLAGFACVCT